MLIVPRAGTTYDCMEALRLRQQNRFIKQSLGGRQIRPWRDHTASVFWLGRGASIVRCLCNVYTFIVQYLNICLYNVCTISLKMFVHLFSFTMFVNFLCTMFVHSFVHFCTFSANDLIMSPPDLFVCCSVYVCVYLHSSMRPLSLPSPIQCWSRVPWVF